MAALLPSPELIFVDANGAPYAGGSLQTLIPGTTTNKNTWSEPTGTALNTNPIVLDAAGRCIVYGDGAYRLILQDALGNTIFDQQSNTLVSTAMAPVCLAPDIPTAQGLLGIVSSTAALGTLTSGLASANAAITAETTRAQAAETALTSSIATQATNLANAETTILATFAAMKIKAGNTGPTDGGGHFRVVFPAPFGAIWSFIAQTIQMKLEPVVMVVEFDPTGADVWALNSTNGVPVVTNFSWIAVGQ